MNNEIVPRCDSAMYLRPLLDTNNTNRSLVEEAISSFNRSFHGFMSRFGSCNSTTKNKLLHQYCTAMYGSQLWDLTSQSVKPLCTKWRIAHRKVTSLPYNSPCDFLTVF